MASLILPRRFTEQPQGAVALNSQFEHIDRTSLVITPTSPVNLINGSPVLPLFGSEKIVPAGGMLGFYSGNLAKWRTDYSRSVPDVVLERGETWLALSTVLSTPSQAYGGILASEEPRGINVWNISNNILGWGQAGPIAFGAGLQFFYVRRDTLVASSYQAGVFSYTSGTWAHSSFSGTAGSNPNGNYTATIGGDPRYSTSRYVEQALHAGLVVQKYLSLDQIEQLRTDLWGQIFKRQPQVLYFDVGGGGGGATVVETTKAAAFSVRNFATGPKAAAFSVRNLTSALRSGAWSVLAPGSVSAEAIGGWSVRNAVVTTRGAAWSVYNAAQAAKAGAWSVRNVLATTRSGAWAVRGYATATKAAAFSVRNLVAQTQAGAWSVQESGVASATQSGAWAVRNLVAATKASGWSVRQAISTSKAGAWSVRASVSAEQTGSWSSYNYATAIQGGAWSFVGLATGSVSGAWSVAGTGLSDADIERIANAMWVKPIEGLTAEEMMRVMLAALAGKREGLGTATERYMARDGVTPRITLVPDANGNGTPIVDGAP